MMANDGEIAEDTLLEPERLGARAIDWDLRCRGLSSGRAVKALQLRRRIHGRSRSSASFNRKTLAPREPSIHGSSPMASAPSHLIMGGLPTEATLAHVLVSKYADHLPLYRQSQILARAGLDLHRAVLADWVGKTAFHLKPVVDRLAEHLKRSSKLFMEFAGDRRPSGAA